MANTTYILTVYVGQRTDVQFVTYAVELVVGATSVASDATLRPAAGTFALDTVTYNSGSSPGTGHLIIRLTGSGGGQADFDQVAITATSSTQLTLGPASLPAVTLDFAYSAQLTASGGTPPYTFSVVSGGLPTGLTLSSSGLISGTPTQPGTSTFTVQVKDAANQTAQLTYTLGTAPANCTYSVNPPSTSLQISGGTGGFSVSTQTGCPSGILIDDSSWIHLTSSTTLSGGGSVSLSVDANAGPAGRASVVGVTNAAGALVGTYAITQAGAGARHHRADFCAASALSGDGHKGRKRL